MRLSNRDDEERKWSGDRADTQRVDVHSLAVSKWSLCMWTYQKVCRE